jgi:hypothetical protein
MNRFLWAKWHPEEPPDGKKGLQLLDVGAVHAYADGFASALISDDRELIATYLCEDQETNISVLLDALSGPIEEAEVLIVDRLECTEFPYTSAGSDFLSVTRLSGTREDVTLRTVWTQTWHQPLIRKAQIVERNAH